MSNDIKLEVLLDKDMGSKLGQCRTTPIGLGPTGPKAFLAAYCADGNIDPSEGQFFYPSDSLKISVLTVEGEILWKRDLGMGVVPGIWFCPIFTFDLNGDGIDEIWFVNNLDERHPLARRNYTLTRLNALDGKITGQWEWPLNYDELPLGYAYRYFIFGGYAKETPVLVTAQGTYNSMYLQGWNPDMSIRWNISIGKDDPGARGSHMCPIIDINHDGIDEFMWGERCISIDNGIELFCADRDLYSGHSDIIQPVMDWEKGSWLIYTCRESDVSPRVVMFDYLGKQVWGNVEYGHMHFGWVARLGDNHEPTANAQREVISSGGLISWEQFVFKAMSGEPHDLSFIVTDTTPVDINGDGYHEIFIRNKNNSASGSLIDRLGNRIGYIGGRVSMASKFMDLPGEQLLVYYDDGKLRIWVDRNAEDRPEAIRRYKHPFYRKNQALSAMGYNINILSGL